MFFLVQVKFCMQPMNVKMETPGFWFKKNVHNNLNQVYNMTHSVSCSFIIIKIKQTMA